MKTIVYSLLLMFLFSSISCTKMNELHQPYLDEGEGIYAAKLDSVLSFSGKNRVKLKLFFPATRIDKVSISWGFGDEKEELNIDKENVEGNVSEVIIPNLPEGNMFFTVVTYDSFNNASIPNEVNADIYGDYFQSELLNRMMKKNLYQDSELMIEWGRIPDKSVGVEITYTDINDKVVTTVFPIENKTIIEGVKANTFVKYRTLFLPVENSIDTFYSNYDEIQIEL